MHIKISNDKFGRVKKDSNTYLCLMMRFYAIFTHLYMTVLKVTAGTLTVTVTVFLIAIYI